MTRGWPLLALALAGCDSQPGPASAPDAAPSEAPVAKAKAAAGTMAATSGASSALTGTTSSLTGAVSDFQVERTPTETRVALAADTLFAFDQATLGPEAQASLERTAGLIREGGTGTVRVVGHTDAKGDDAYNDALSKRRAEAVVAWLKTQPGLATREYSVDGRGKREPVAPETTADGGDDPAGRARNRRVVVIIPR